MQIENGDDRETCFQRANEPVRLKMENSHIALYFRYLCWKIISTNFQMNSQNL